jgi:periplasmic divalent cation tolerance protein
MSHIVVLTTCANREQAEQIAEALVTERLAACCTIAGAVTSIYRWHEALERAEEVLMMVKTTEECFPLLEARVRELHTYEVPELIALPITAGSQPYLAWLQAGTQK